MMGKSSFDAYKDFFATRPSTTICGVDRAFFTGTSPAVVFAVMYFSSREEVSPVLFYHLVVSDDVTVQRYL